MKLFIKDLKEGIHEFHHTTAPGEIEVPDREYFPHSLDLSIFVDRLEDLFRIRIRVRSRAHYVCDRCLSEFEESFDETIEQLYQIGHSDLDGEDDIIFLPDNTTEIDLSRDIQDALLMSRPIQVLCREDCRGLCPDCGKNLNEGPCECRHEAVDPRLAGLKKFLQ